MKLVPADPGMARLLGLTVAVLIIGTLTGQILKRTVRTERAQAAVANIIVRVATYWVLFALVGLALLLGEGAVIGLFALFSFLALREFVTLTPTNRADHRSLFWSFF